MSVCTCASVATKNAVPVAHASDETLRVHAFTCRAQHVALCTYINITPEYYPGDLYSNELL